MAVVLRVGHSCCAIMRRYFMPDLASNDIAGEISSAASESLTGTIKRQRLEREKGDDSSGTGNDRRSD